MLEHHVRLAIKGSKEAFVYLIEELEPSLYRIAKGILFNDADCADAIQEAIIKAYHGIDRLKNPKYFKTWLIRILINECNNLLKSKRKIIPVEEFTNLRVQTDMTQNLEIWDALKSLNENMRIIIILYYIEGWSLKETAELLNIAEGTAKSRLSRARAELASYFDEASYTKRGVKHESL